jgi:hypothetical protein
MDRRSLDAHHLRAVAAGAGTPSMADEADDLEGPSFLPPMQRRSRSGRTASQPVAGKLGTEGKIPMPAVAPKVQATKASRRAAPATRSSDAAPSGWMTDVEQLAAAAAPPIQAPWHGGATRPGGPAPAGLPGGGAGHGGSPFRPQQQPAFASVAPRSLALVACVAVLLIGVVAGVAALLGKQAEPVVATAKVAKPQLRQLVGQLEECRGIESLLVMLANGPEREATLVRLQGQQKEIDTWLQDNNAWLTTTHGAQAVTELREASAAWRALQLRVVEAEVVEDRTGLARESRQLLTGPSAAAYRRVIDLVDGMAQRRPS